MKTRADYDRAFEVVREIINAWDPYGLLAMGAPSGEWDDEVARIVASLAKIHSERDAADTISQVFTTAFQAQDFAPDDCAAVGRRLFDALARPGLCSAP